jgi:DNA-binding NarL/FixJ family response regulator
MAIERIIGGESFFSQKLLLNLVNSNKSQSDIDLTKRELEILQQIAKGLSTQEISDKLFISFRTVERHRANLLLKTQTNNSLKLLIYAIKHNLVDI